MSLKLLIISSVLLSICLMNCNSLNNSNNFNTPTSIRISAVPYFLSSPIALSPESLPEIGDGFYIDTTISNSETIEPFLDYLNQLEIYNGSHGIDCRMVFHLNYGNNTSDELVLLTGGYLVLNDSIDFYPGHDFLERLGNLLPKDYFEIYIDE